MRHAQPDLLDTASAGRTQVISAEDELAELTAHAARSRYQRRGNELLERAHRILVGHSIAALRVALGAVFLAFGVLKFFPGVSPAENLATTTTTVLSFGLIPGGVAIVAVAALECLIGIGLLANRWMRVTLALLAGELVGILSPAVLLSGRLFSGPHGAPTLEGQYVLKDVILVAAAMVIAAATFKGGRLVRDEPPPAPPSSARRSDRPDAAGQLELALNALGASRAIREVCATHAISPAAYYDWRDAVLAASCEESQPELITAGAGR